VVGARGDDATVAVSPHAGYGEYVATEGEGMVPAELSWLRSFYAKLRDKRARVRPHIPSQPDFADKGGFALRARVAGDDHLLIRGNEHANLTEKGRTISRLPSTLP